MEAEVGLGGERLSETLGPWGDTVSAGRTRPCPGCARLPARPAQGKGTVWLCVESVRAVGLAVAAAGPPTSQDPGPSVQAAGWLSGGEVGTLHGVEPVDGVPHAGLQGAHVRGAEEAVAEAG